VAIRADQQRVADFYTRQAEAKQTRENAEVAERAQR